MIQCKHFTGNPRLKTNCALVGSLSKRLRSLHKIRLAARWQSPRQHKLSNVEKSFVDKSSWGSRSIGLLPGPLNFGHGHRGRIFHAIRPLLHSTFTAAPIPRRLGPDSSEIASKWAGHASIQGLAVLIVERLGRPHARRALTSTHAVEAIADLILTGCTFLSL